MSEPNVCPDCEGELVCGGCGRSIDPYAPSPAQLGLDVEAHAAFRALLDTDTKEGEPHE